ncbi:50S ribosomal protein L24 [Candidatus Nomurabacteria bacterium]|nr:50S ribosomal protein L24 [Candidatus Nomurabacteria bacterium]
MMKIKKGDNVIVLAGKDKGKTGKVLRSLPSLDKVIVEGVNVVKKHQKSRQQGKAGEIIDRTLPIHVSNVALMDKSGKATRLSSKVVNGKKVRVSVKSGEEI